MPELLPAAGKVCVMPVVHAALLRAVAPPRSAVLPSRKYPTACSETGPDAEL